MTLPEIENILFNAMGLNVRSIGSTAVETAVSERMAACQLNDIKSYQEKLVADRNELKELIEEVVVPETWFFRDDNPFKMLVKYTREEWLPSNPDRPLRVLSLPCSTGEEPYSMAMALVDAGLMPSQVSIHAFDISRRNIKHCRQAAYGNNSFRGVEPRVRDRFFKYWDNAYHLDILIRAMVSFDTTSIFDPAFVATCLPYDVVFCRNLLIYFDRPTQQRAATVLGKILNPNGILFVGHAETGIFLGKWHVSHRYPRAFALRKFKDDTRYQSKEESTRKQDTKVKKTTKSVTPKHIPQKLPKAADKRLTVKSSQPTSAAAPVSKQDLEIVRRLADDGNFIQAEKVCVRYLEQFKQDSNAYFLLALIQLGAGDVQKASQYLRNVIYLDPSHYEALMYLSTLTQQQGDTVQAQRFRERAQRVKLRSAWGEQA